MLVFTAALPLVEFRSRDFKFRVTGRGDSISGIFKLMQVYIIIRNHLTVCSYLCFTYSEITQLARMLKILYISKKIRPSIGQRQAAV